MSGYLEAWDPGPEVLRLAGERVTIGRGEGNDLVLTSDPTISRLHAVIERFGAEWCLRDLGSRGGTFVNGERVFADHVLRPGDEMRVGRTRLVYRAGGATQATATQTPVAAPLLTNREHDVLLALCAPLLSGRLFTEPASVRDIASSLVVTEAAVRQHLMHLYEKFGLSEGASHRRMHLANEAIGRGAVTVADLRASATGRNESAG